MSPALKLAVSVELFLRNLLNVGFKSLKAINKGLICVFFLLNYEVRQNNVGP